MKKLILSLFLTLAHTLGFSQLLLMGVGASRTNSFTPPPPPYVVASTDNLTTPGYTMGNGPGISSGTFKLYANGISGNITLTVTSDFQLSSDGATWGSSLSVTYPGGAFVSGSIYRARIKSGLSVNTYTGAIFLSGTGAPGYTITLNSQVYDELFIIASGGIETIDGNFKIHTFNSSGLFDVTAIGTGTNNSIQYLIAGGGGGGGGYNGGGGGGAGGLLTGTMIVSANSYPISIGAGGPGGIGGQAGGNGSNSTFNSLTAFGGGGGAGTGGGPSSAAGTGGSGGGGARNNLPGSAVIGQGNNGGAGDQILFIVAAGGGGAGAVGGDGVWGGTYPTSTNGSGGIGIQSTISGSATYYCGGGGAGSVDSNTGYPGIGGLGGGGDGATADLQNGNPGSPNSGGGGGGAARTVGTSGGDGGAGIVIIRYKFQ